jgi:hypothetical protein
MAKRVIDADTKMAALLGRHFCLVCCFAPNPGRERRVADPGKVKKAVSRFAVATTEPDKYVN